MRELIAGRNDEGQRLDRFVGKAVPLLPSALLQKYIRTKRIKLEGKGAKRDVRISEGDRVQLYINDEFFDAPSRDNTYLGIVNPRLGIVYQDENLMLCDKPPGLLCHPAQGSGESLLDHIKAYLYQSGQWKPREENSFAPALCNRLDRNTGGLIIAAKNAPALRILNEKIKNHEIGKYYLCAVEGTPEPKEAELSAYILRDSEKNRVEISQAPIPGGKESRLLYRTLETAGNLSLVECELITGRTHQIRALLAHAGTPLLGDVKYGGSPWPEGVRERGQALYSYRLEFNFDTPAGSLDYLKNQSFSVERIQFVENHFNFRF